MKKATLIFGALCCTGCMTPSDDLSRYLSNGHADKTMLVAVENPARPLSTDFFAKPALSLEESLAKVAGRFRKKDLGLQQVTIVHDKYNHELVAKSLPLLKGENKTITYLLFTTQPLIADEQSSLSSSLARLASEGYDAAMYHVAVEGRKVDLKRIGEEDAW